MRIECTEKEAADFILRIQNRQDTDVVDFTAKAKSWVAEAIRDMPVESAKKN